MSSASSAEAVTRDEVADAPSDAGELTEQEQQILALERQWWKYAGAKDQAISDQLGISAVSYYQLLNRLIDSEAALAHDPMLVKRLRRQRDARQRARASRR
ncbi:MULTISPECIES: DUF3263 domain-containing protein [unclassified Nesterenkonia]|uniref:DUF3263 domain-containing protein n=1 Tax=unclassified Nesterenkonia TaxID=2629769 RepID=UPI000873157C|nr:MULTISPECIES: DUF3263 domain-containing protein [unclassified Nesterenkonia]MDS2172338.1 DUF3263 domain-containing protein [Nesterenkonia sp. CL21]OSM42540.1 hypothetical protein BCY76_013815 [Nesterenkonia sp. PF2B19]